jgi:hypothetical protein
LATPDLEFIKFGNFISLLLIHDCIDVTIFGFLASQSLQERERPRTQKFYFYFYKKASDKSMFYENFAGVEVHDSAIFILTMGHF